jgi:hypothetical protein
MDFQSIIKNLKDDQLEDLRREVTEAAEARRRDASLDWIKPGMATEDKDRARREIADALREMGR